MKIQDGQNSILNITHFYDVDRFTGEFGNKLLNSVTYEFYHPVIIEVGNQISTELEVIPYRVLYIEDESLPFGERQIIQIGSEGVTQHVEAYELDYSTGELLSDIHNFSISNGATDEIIAVGNKADWQDEILEFETIYLENLNLSFKEEKIISQVKNGYWSTRGIYSVDPTTGELIYEGNYPEEGGQDPIPEIIEIGNVEGLISETGHNVQYIRNNNLPYGIREVVQEGISAVNKEKVIYSVDSDGNLTVSEILTELISEKVHHIVHIGTAGVEGVIDPYETSYFSDPDLPYNTIVKVQEGIDGNSLTGQIRQDDIYIVGNISDEKVISVPYEIQYRANSNLDFGEQRVIQEGVNGQESLTYWHNVNYHTGKFFNYMSDRTKINDAISMIIEVGNRQIEYNETKYPTYYFEDLMLPFGTSKIVQVGQNSINGTEHVFEIDR